jgi:hypothetical protein
MATKKKTASKKASKPEVGVPFSRDDLNEMEHGSLIVFARLDYGLEMNTTAHPKDEVIEAIMNAARKFKGNSEMKVVEKDADVEVPPDYVKIRVSPGDHNPNAHPIPIGLNFRLATIPCNMDVVMHKKWLPCLQDAVQTKYFTKRDPITGHESLQSQPQHSYPFSILQVG